MASDNFWKQQEDLCDFNDDVDEISSGSQSPAKTPTIKTGLVRNTGKLSLDNDLNSFRNLAPVLNREFRSKSFNISAQDTSKCKTTAHRNRLLSKFSFWLKLEQSYSATILKPFLSSQKWYILCVIF